MDELQQMMYLFNQAVSEIDLKQIEASLRYARDQEYQLRANVLRLRALPALAKTLPPFANVELDAPAEANFGLTQLCLPQADAYDAMPAHRWRRVRAALADVASEEDVTRLVAHCEARYLYFGWAQMREALTILGRPQFRRLLWQLAGPRVAEVENLPLVMEVLPKEEREAMRAAYWPPE